MTRAHRQYHRRITLALAVLVPIVFIVGVLARRSVPVMPAATDPIAPLTSPLSLP